MKNCNIISGPGLSLWDFFHSLYCPPSENSCLYNKPVGKPFFILCLDGQGPASHCKMGFIQTQQGLVQVILLTVPLSVSQSVRKAFVSYNH